MKNYNFKIVMVKIIFERVTLLHLQFNIIIFVYCIPYICNYVNYCILSMYGL